MLGGLILPQLKHEFDARLRRWLVLPHCRSLDADRSLPRRLLLSQRHGVTRHQRVPTRIRVSAWQLGAHFLPGRILLRYGGIGRRDGPLPR
jgi:hypothetical protein